MGDAKHLKQLCTNHRLVQLTFRQKVKTYTENIPILRFIDHVYGIIKKYGVHLRVIQEGIVNQAMFCIWLEASAADVYTFKRVTLRRCLTGLVPV